MSQKKQSAEVADEGGRPLNAVLCLACRTVIVSAYRHDFRWCNCPEGSDTRIFIDGGTRYCRMGGGTRAAYEPVKAISWLASD